MECKTCTCNLNRWYLTHRLFTTPSKVEISNFFLLHLKKIGNQLKFGWLKLTNVWPLLASQLPTSFENSPLLIIFWPKKVHFKFHNFQCCMMAQSDQQHQKYKIYLSNYSTWDRFITLVICLIYTLLRRLYWPAIVRLCSFLYCIHSEVWRVPRK